MLCAWEQNAKNISRVYSLDNNEGTKKRPLIANESVDSPAKRAKLAFDYKGTKIEMVPYEYCPSEEAKRELTSLMYGVTAPIIADFRLQQAKSLEQLKGDMTRAITNLVTKEEHKGSFSERFIDKQ